jgi:cyanophycinase-like exopeptidase
MKLMDTTRQEANRSRRRAGRAIAGGSAGLGLLGSALIAVGGAAIGAIAAFLADPARGRGRRARLIDQGVATARRAGRQAEQVVRSAGSLASGKLEAMTEGGSRVAPTDDVTIRDRAETELFRDPSIPKGDINLSVERGVLVLRGEVPDAEMRDRLEREAEGIEGVWSVRNLLHLPGEPVDEQLVGSASS